MSRNDLLIGHSSDNVSGSKTSGKQTIYVVGTLLSAHSLSRGTFVKTSNTRDLTKPQNPHHGQTKQMVAESPTGDISDVTGFAGRPDIRRVITKIKQIQKYSEDPDEDDNPVTIAVMRNAIALAIETARESYCADVKWIPPSVFSTPSGGIQLSWRLGDCSIRLNVHDADKPVICATRDKSGVSRLQELTLKQSVKEMTSFLKQVAS